MWVIFALPESGPDPAVKTSVDPEPDPELQHWNKVALLIAVSFSAMFEHDMEEKKNSRVEVKDVEADVMADMLRYADMLMYPDMLRYPDMHTVPRRLFIPALQ